MFCSLLTAVLLTTPQSGRQWVQLDGPLQPRYQAAFDASRGRLVAVGSVGDIWEFEGATRLHRANLGTEGGPPQRFGGVMASDPRRGVTLLFGGFARLGPRLADTWEWNGSAWSRGVGGVAPPARTDAAMTYDVRRERFVLYSGQGDAGPLYDTWEYDETGWSEVSTPNPPPGGRHMVYDSARGVCVLVSSPGLVGAPMYVYEYDGVDWTARPPSGPCPTRRQNMSLAYDERREVTVMIGGTRSAEEIWEWDGDGWTLAHTLPVPWRSGASAHYDPARGAVVVLGGQAGTPPTTHTDAHSWDGTTFAQLWPDHSPSRRYGHYFFADPLRGNLVVHGSSTQADDTWVWEGNGWRQLQLQNPPPPLGGALTYDTVRGLGLVFGGLYQGNLWSWDGSDWNRLPTTGGPAPRWRAGMAFDPDRGVAVVFGGLTVVATRYTYSTVLHDDTWEWDGAAWSYRPGAVQPPPRFEPTLVYDETRGVMLMFGGRVGFTGADYLDDTWEWDGVTWREIQSIQKPSLRDARLVYDPDRRRPVLVGGNTDFLLEVWEFDGADWLPLERNIAKVLNGTPDVVWDERRQQITAYDGLYLRSWTARAATATTYGTGCGSAPLPMVRTRARLGETQFGFEARVAPRQRTLFAVGLAPASTPFAGGCTLLVKPMRVSLVTADGYGTASLVLPLPEDPVYGGLTVFAQAAVRDAGTQGGWGTSAGMRVVLGD